MHFLISVNSKIELPPLVIHACNTTFNNNCSCPSLDNVSVIKYLGVLIDSTLSFKYHIEQLAERTRKLIYVFRKLRNVANPSVLRTVYCALCQSILSYCITSWGGVSKSTLMTIERAQRSVLKTGYSLPFQYPTTALYKHCNVLTVRQLFVLYIILKKHSVTIYDSKSTTGTRRKKNVCPLSNFKTSFSHKFYPFLGDLLYNKANTYLSIYSVPKNKCKKLVTE